MAHSKIDNTFNRAMDKLTELSSVFREDGKLAEACGSDCDLNGVRSAFEELMGAMREAHTEATMEESVTEDAGKVGYMEMFFTDRDGGEVSYEVEVTLNNGKLDVTGPMPGPEDDLYWDDADIDEQLRDAMADPSVITWMNEAMGAPDYNPSRGEYDSNREYGMFSDEGNAEVAELVDDIVKRHEAGEFDSPERAIDAAMSDLMTLSDDNDDFGEASDTDVRDQVARDLDSRIGRDSGFGEAIEYMKKLAGIE